MEDLLIDSSQCSANNRKKWRENSQYNLRSTYIDTDTKIKGLYLFTTPNSQRDINYSLSVIISSQGEGYTFFYILTYIYFCCFKCSQPLSAISGLSTMMQTKPRKEYGAHPNSVHVKEPKPMTCL